MSFVRGPRTGGSGQSGREVVYSGLGERNYPRRPNVTASSGSGLTDLSPSLYLCLTGWSMTPISWLPRSPSAALRRLSLLAPIAGLLVPAPAAMGQVPNGGEGRDGGVLVGWGEVGIGIGHVPRVTGLRMNWQDRDLDRVRGINLTLWRPAEGVGGRVDGLALGLMPAAGRIRGVGAGLVAVLGEEHLSGVQMAGLASVSGGTLRGVSLGGLAAIGGDRLHGFSAGGLAVIGAAGFDGAALGGLAVVAGERARGFSAAGLAAISEGSMEGAHAGGLAVVAGGPMRGVQAGGLAVVSGGPMRGIQAGGLATVAGGHMDGVQAGGLAVVGGESVRGIQLSVGKIQAATRLQGISLAGGWVDANEMTGLSGSTLNRFGTQVGVSVGIVNWADELRGLQLGALNRAGNNPHPFRYLPLLNARF